MTSWARTSVVLGAVWVVLSLVWGCGHTPDEAAYGGALSSQDPLVQLPRVDRYVEMMGSYQFGTRRLAHIEVAEIRLGQSGHPASRVVLARAYLDAALYGELAGDQALTKALGERLGGSLWPGLRGYFRQVLKELRSDGGAEFRPHIEAMEQGLELVQLLEARLFNTDYHRRLKQLSEPDRPFAVEARIGRLLDLDRALVELSSVPMEERLGLLFEVLGGTSCAKPREVPKSGAGKAWRKALSQACPATCADGVERASGAEPGRRGPLMVLTCGYAVSGWPEDAELGLYAPELAAVAAMYAQALEMLKEVAGQEGHPLALAGRPQLFAMLSRWTSMGLTVPLPVEAATDVARVPLPVVRTDDEASVFVGDPKRFVMLDRQGGWVGVMPTVAVSEQGGLALLEGEYSFPGVMVFAHGRETEEAGMALKANHLKEVWDSALAKVREVSLRGSRASGLSRGEVVLWADTGMRLAEFKAALEVVRQGLGQAGGLRVRWLVWDAKRAELGMLPVVLRPPGSYGAQSNRYRGLPQEATPLELTVELNDTGVKVVARGQQVAQLERGADGALDHAGLVTVLKQLKSERPSDAFADVEVTGERSTVQELAEVTAAIEPLFSRLHLFGR
ncbi:MAG: hypothetical protein AAFX99_05980 [Myxococcota bacterium]